MEPAWEHFDHGADIGVRGWGATPEEAFAHAALALVAVITDPARVRPREAVEITLEESDLEYLLYAWLGALVSEMALRRMLFGRFEVAIEDGTRLRGRAWGEPVDPDRHRPAVEVKGPTFTALAVRREPDGRWRAQCVVDV
ncbi:archease [Inmirania thermothiophila]|uniref:SHS2 domain-containing protein n=1 Tax=Inmirania thermothiophila TaxID=1750597 RepID=A0A3N1Y5L9_9GAMM|nr:archease [Inmirania thermothiophila]ROR32587.1 SHS2 domain-containing protein [Inmirania thermothiophila]